MNCCCSGEEKKLSEKSMAIKKFYNDAAEGIGIYDKDTEKFSPDGPTQEIVDNLYKSGKTHILDIGCGMGTTLARIAGEYDDAELMIGIDFSEKMIERANERKMSLPDELKKKMGFFRGDICEIPYMDETFDFVYVECVLNLVEDRKKAIEEVKRVLKKGGIFYYTDFVSNVTVPVEIKDDLNLVSGCRAGAITMDENIRYLQDAGFIDIEIVDYSYEKEKRYKEILENSEEIRKQIEYFEKKNPFAADFLEREMGYYVISCAK
jgi:ubiquinone/menaquinone biosynthesis C-methylase UbiE